VVTDIKNYSRKVTFVMCNAAILKEGKLCKFVIRDTFILLINSWASIPFSGRKQAEIVAIEQKVFINNGRDCSNFLKPHRCSHISAI
jgi:hypothetical protein